MKMTEIRGLLQAAVSTTWDAERTIVWENAPNTAAMEANTTGKFLVVSILWEQNDQMEMGPDSRLRLHGKMLLRFVEPVLTGTAELEAKCQEVLETFNRKWFDGVTTLTPYFGPSEEQGGSYQQLVYVPFFAELDNPS